MNLEIAISPSPADPGAESGVSRPRRAVRRGLAYMRVHCHRRLPLAEVASVAHMSPCHFSRSFHHIVGVRFQDHLVRLRLRNAAQLLRRDPSAPLRNVAAQTGFGTLRNLQDHYRRFFGCPPSLGRVRGRYDAVPWGDAQGPSPFEGEWQR
jgi:transcriptional regulator GlxA family with amidase domain